MRIFVTGGTGLLGNVLLRQLSGPDNELIALVRGEPDKEVFEGIDATFVRGDICDQEVIESAVQDCDAVFNSAGLIHIGWTRLDESMHVNRDGARVVAEACMKYDCKLVHIGTVNAMALGTIDQPANEETPRDNAGGQIPCSYVVSKRAGCDEVQRLVGEGLRAVLVHPGFMVGPWDWKPSSGRMMLELSQGWRPMAPLGGCCVCDPRDVAAGTIAAFHKGGDDGRDYILGGVNWRYKKLWSEMAKRMGKSPPWIPAGPLARWGGSWFGDLKTWLTGKEGDINSASIKMTRVFHWHDSSRARQELGYETRDPHESLDALAQWIHEHHLRGRRTPDPKKN